MVSTSEFRTGIVIRYNGDMCEILDFQLVKMQQRQPIVRTKLRNIKTGNVLEIPFRSGEKFEDIYLDLKPLQYLYKEDTKYHFMETESYHEIIVNESSMGDKIYYLKDNMELSGKFAGEELIMLELPASVVLKIVETEPGVRGDTAKSGNKPAKVETGATVKVPLFVNNGDDIRVDTRTGLYLERA